MVLYLSLPIVISIVYAFLKKLNLRIGKIRNFALLFCLLLLAIFMGMRGVGVGTDTLLYSNIYNSYRNCSFAFAISQTKYLGWSLYVYILNLFGLDYRLYLFVTSLIMMILCYKTIVFYSNGNQSFLTLLMFMLMYTYCYMFNTFRYYFAIMIVVYSTTMLLDKKFIKFFILVLLATSIHATCVVSLLFLPVWLIVKKPNREFLYVLSVVIFVFLALFINPLFSVFVKVFAGYDIYYSGSQVDLSSTSNGRTLILRLVEIIILVYFLIMCNKTLKKNAKYRFLIFIFAIANIAGLFYYDQILINRFFSVLLSFDFITIGCLGLKIEKKQDLVFTIFALCASFAVFYTIMLKGNYGEIIPYNF